ncbi:MAG: fused response regulator/phosphatase [Kofleriaceae bacterium]
MVAAASAKPSHRVLVVDDEETIGRSIARILKAHQVSTATTVARGIELARTIDPELVIVDFYLPDGTGKDVVEALRATGNRAPVLIMSGAVDATEWAEWAFYAADDLLPKPFPPDQLRAKAERLLSQFVLEQTAARQHAELQALMAAQARETDAARKLLDRMTQRSQFDPAHVKVEALSAGPFGGDSVLGQTLDDGRYRWLVGDVTGHTLASALVTIPISLIFYATTRRNMPMAEMVQTMDRELGAMLPVSMFFAAQALELDREAGTLTVVNAGCPDVVIKRANGDIESIESTEPPLGIMRGAVLPEPVVVKVAPGDRIFAFTDGLVERCSEDGTLFGPERVRQLIGRATPEAAFEKLSSAWRDYAPGTALADDLSIIEVIV